MSRKLMIILLSSTLVLSNMSTSAWSAADVSVGHAVQVGDPVKNQAPLPPAGAAGIQQAQGFVQDYPLLTIALVAGLVAVVWILLDDDDDDDEVVSTGT